RLKGYVLFDVAQDSENVATSLAGVLEAIAVDPASEPRARAHGLSLLLDARGLDEKWCRANYPNAFNRDVVCEQLEVTSGLMRDLGVYQRALTYFDHNSSMRTDVARSCNVGARVYGWGGNDSEAQFFAGVSKGGGVPVVANTSANLSVLSQLPVV